MRHLINASDLQEKSSVSLLSAGIMSRAAYSRKAVSCDNHHAGVVAFLESLAEPLFDFDVSRRLGVAGMGTHALFG